MMANAREIRDAARDSGIPAYMVDAVVGYVVDHYQPGSFLRAVISNDLTRAVLRADDTNIRHLPNYVRFFYNHAPSACWGSPEAYTSWVNERAS